MANTIRLRRSATSGAVPGTSDLALGEIAMNTYDGKLFIKKDVSGTESIVEVGGGGSVSIASSAPAAADSAEGDIYWDSNDGTAYIYYDDGNGAAQWVPLTPVAEALIPGANVTKLDDISSGFNTSDVTFNLTVGSAAHAPDYPKAVLVSLGGVIQEVDTDYTISGSQITFTTAPASGLSFFAIDLGNGIPIGTPNNDTVGPDQLIDTAVTAGSYTLASITVDAQGRITAASSGTAGAVNSITQGNTSAEVEDVTPDGNGHFKVTTEGTEQIRIGPNGEIGINGANYGSSGQVLTSKGLNNRVAWEDAAGGGATGGGSDKIFQENGQTVTTNYTIGTTFGSSNCNAMVAGPITINANATVTVPSTANLIIL